MSLVIDAKRAREALSELPRGDNVRPGEEIRSEDVYVVRRHWTALDPESALVVANRGMGKSLWAHALRDKGLREHVAAELSLRGLAAADTRLAFNGGVSDHTMPTPDSLQHALDQGFAPRQVFHGVVLGHLLEPDSPLKGMTLVERLVWMNEHPDDATRLRELGAARGRVLLLFDGLDRLGGDWPTTRELLKGLLQVALEMQSTRTVRLKLFLRRDQFEDPRPFEFPDSSKLRNTRADLDWLPSELYGLLFFRLRKHGLWTPSEERNQETLVASLAGSFMGADRRRGSVFTWIPKHLADARGEISPRTFLTMWREAALHASHSTSPPETAVDAKAIHVGVQRASEDRMNELREDYPWVELALQSIPKVPLPEADLEALWASENAFAKMAKAADENGRRIWMPSWSETTRLVTLFVDALRAIGVVERRPNGKIDVPDIFRLYAGIPRHGGVPPRKPT